MHRIWHWIFSEVLSSGAVCCLWTVNERKCWNLHQHDTMIKRNHTDSKRDVCAAQLSAVICYRSHRTPKIHFGVGCFCSLRRYLRGDVIKSAAAALFWCLTMTTLTDNTATIIISLSRHTAHRRNIFREQHMPHSRHHPLHFLSLISQLPFRPSNLWMPFCEFFSRGFPQ